jgi:hypothetical protein
MMFHRIRKSLSLLYSNQHNEHIPSLFPSIQRELTLILPRILLPSLLNIIHRLYRQIPNLKIAILIPDNDI